MHRRLEAELLPLDIELESTLRNLKKVRVAKTTIMAEREETNQNIPAVGETKNNGGLLETYH